MTSASLFAASSEHTLADMHFPFNSFQHHQPAQPVLSHSAIYDTLDQYTLGAPDKASLEAAQLFRLFMVMAIGSIHSFRNGTCEPHPFGYFTAALEVWTPSMSSFNTIDDIEHLLLIAQFGLFYDIGMILIYVFLYFCIFRYVATYVLLQDARCGSLGD